MVSRKSARRTNERRQEITGHGRVVRAETKQNCHKIRGGEGREQAFKVREERKRKALVGISCEDNARPRKEEAGVGVLMSGIGYEEGRRLGSGGQGQGRGGHGWAEVDISHEGTSKQCGFKYPGELLRLPGRSAWHGCQLLISVRSACFVSSEAERSSASSSLSVSLLFFRNGGRRVH